MATIYEKLKAYSDSDYYGFHMPGHKRKMHMSWDADPYTVDITEIDTFSGKWKYSWNSECYRGCDE